MECLSARVWDDQDFLLEEIETVVKHLIFYKYFLV